MTVDELRRRARHRLIGSTILVVGAVILFPLLLDAPPRTVAPTIPIVMGSKPEQASASAVKPAMVAEPSRAGSGKVDATSSLADNEQIVESGDGSRPGNATSKTGAAAVAATAAVATAVAVRNGLAAAQGTAASQAKPASRPAAARPAPAAPSASAADQQKQRQLEQQKRQKQQAQQEQARRQEAQAKARADADAKVKAKADADARAKKEAARQKAAQQAATQAAATPARQPASSSPSGKKPAAAYNFPDKGRFVVQVGPSVENSKVAAVRQKLQKAGIGNYTQVVKVDGKEVTRVRMGPFASRKEMERVAAKVKALGLPVSMYSY